MAYPSSYKEEYCDQLIEHMRKGLSYEAFAGVIGVSNKTIHTWEGKHPEWKEAKGIGFNACRIFWEKLGVDLATGGKGNATVWIANMNNRFWKRDNGGYDKKIKVDSAAPFKAEDAEAILEQAEA
jgi:DNA-binding XRE family transcriptional regulator